MNESWCKLKTKNSQGRTGYKYCEADLKYLVNPPGLCHFCNKPHTNWKNDPDRLLFTCLNCYGDKEYKEFYIESQGHFIDLAEFIDWRIKMQNNW